MTALLCYKFFASAHARTPFTTHLHLLTDVFRSFITVEKKSVIALANFLYSVSFWPKSYCLKAFTVTQIFFSIWSPRPFWLDPYLRDFLYTRHLKFVNLVWLRLRHIHWSEAIFTHELKDQCEIFFSPPVELQIKGVSVYLWIINALLNYPLLSAVYWAPRAQAQSSSHGLKSKCNLLILLHTFFASPTAPPVRLTQCKGLVLYAAHPRAVYSCLAFIMLRWFVQRPEHLNYHWSEFCI